MCQTKSRHVLYITHVVLTEMACTYMGTEQPAAVFLLGHWNDASSGCPAGADVPEVHALLLTLPGNR